MNELQNNKKNLPVCTYLNLEIVDPIHLQVLGFFQIPHLSLIAEEAEI